METAESTTVETVLQIKESISFCVGQLKPYDAIVKAAVDECKTLSILNAQDKDGYYAVSEARKTLKAKRIEVEKKTKELVSQGRVLIDELKKEGDRIILLIKPTEDELSAKEKWYEDEQTRLKKEKEEAEKIRLQTRLSYLLNNGFKVELLDYVLAGSKVHYTQIQKLDDEAWQNIVMNVVEPAIHNNKVEIEAEAERQRKAKEESERKAIEAENKAKELEAKAKELADKEAEFKKREAEIERKLAEIKQVEKDKVDHAPVISNSTTKPIHAPIFRPDTPKSEQVTESKESPSISKQPQPPVSDHYSDSVTISEFINRLSLINLEESVITPEYKELAKTCMTNIKGLQSVLKLKLQQINSKHIQK